MAEVLTQALSLVAIIVLGQIIRRFGWLGKEDFPKLSRLMLSVTLPAILITNFNSFHIERRLFFLILIGIAVNLIQAVTARLLHWRAEKDHTAFAILHSGSYNIGAFAMPYLQAFMGGTTLIYSSLFDIGNALTASGVNYSWSTLIARDKPFSPGAFFRQMLRSPVFVTYLFLLFLQVFNLRLPAALIRFTSIVGGANTFLAMFVIGLGLDLSLPRHKLRKAFLLLMQRYVFALLFLLLTWFCLPFDEEIRKVLCLLYFSPMAAMVTGFTAEIEGDIELSSFINSVTILLAIVMMPLLLGVLKV